MAISRAEVVFVAFLVWSGCSYGPRPAAAEGDAASILSMEAPAGKAERKFRFTYRAELKQIPEGAKSLGLWIPVPQDSKHQVISNVAFDAPVQPVVGTEAQSSNKMAYWNLQGELLKPFVVSMTFDVVRKEISAQNLDTARKLTPAEEEALAPFLKPNRLVLVGEPVRELADKAVGTADSAQQVSKAAYDYVLANMRYDKPAGKSWGQGSTKWACDEKYGNCTDFHALFMSVARTKGVPVKFEMGFPLPADKKEGAIGGYHCWAKFYLGAIGWVPVDASEAWKVKELREYYYGNLTADRVALSVGRDLDLTPKQAGPALNFFIYPYAEADGKVVPVERAFSFKDL